MADVTVQVTFDPLADPKFTFAPTQVPMPGPGVITFNLKVSNSTDVFSSSPINFPYGGPFTVINQKADSFQVEDDNTLTANDPAQTFAYNVNVGPWTSSPDPVIINEPPAEPVG
jgi:hypothetical protein